ncbi:MAG: methionine adenosyltransferase [Planctomycetota bacterium]|nr:MAG: methionine adenosyltransferase [Planctomycetota bacterium]
MERKLFTSESVSMGHPDKVADQISDAVLDACLREDPGSHVACETFVTTGLVLVGGEISTRAHVDFRELVRQVVRDIGYTAAGVGFDADSCAILNVINRQSPDIAQGVHRSEDEQGTGAGDQGMMFGYACRETEAYMPAPIHWAHRLMQRQAQARQSGAIPWLRPDAKSQVSFEYEGDRPVRVDTVVLSTQTSDAVDIREVRRVVEEDIIRHILPAEYLDRRTRFFVNPTGRFVVGGPHGDTGLTGRKIIVDTYGGYARHGGGAFSGKDPTKVDRSAAYCARWVAKNVVAAGLAERCEVQLAYAIGRAEPVSLRVDTFGTGRAPDSAIEQALRRLPQWEQRAPFTPDWIIGRLALACPTGYRDPQGWTYGKTCVHGHFGRDLFPWERLDLVDELGEVLKNPRRAEAPVGSRLDS